ncbi:MAG: pseudaminic acid biosynthesis-associated methylase [bacterium]
MKYQTYQEEFWAGTFGDDIQRNQDKTITATNISLFSRILAHTRNIRSVIELGSNIGLNLVAISQILPDAEISAIEINEKAASILKERQFITVYNQSIFEYTPDYQRDFVFTKGVLIHINPDLLPKTYDLIYQLSRKYICVAEYYNPVPQEIKYRETTETLFKRDFAGELLERFSDVKLVDYGFVYNKDPNFPLDDISWFLLEKT